MAALFGDASVLQDHDPVGGADGRQPVGDDEQGAAGRERGQRVLDQCLGVRVGVRGRLVEHEDRGVGEQGSRDGEALCLTAGESDGRAEFGRVAVGQCRDAVVDAGGAGAPLDFLVGGLGAAQADVVGDARPQQPYVLEDEADPPVQLGRGDVAEVGAAEGHRAGGDVVEAGQERGQGGLAGAGGADQGGDRAGREIEVDVAQDVGAPVVGEGDPAQADVVAVGQDGGGGLGEGRGVQQLRDAYGGGLAGPDLLDAGPTTPMGAATAGPSSRKGTSSAPVSQSWVTSTAPTTVRSSKTTAGATTSTAAVELTRVVRTQREKKSAKPSVASTKRSWALRPRPKLLKTAMPEANSTAAVEIRPSAAPNSAIWAAAPPSPG